MDIQSLFAKDEKPLDRFTPDGGYTRIFRTIGCVGDSLSSGEFESLTADGQSGYHDMYEYSWGQFIARKCGCKVYNFSRGGMTARQYIDTYAAESGFWDKDKACQAYIIALGVNDLINEHQEVGSVADINEDWRKNVPTFAGRYAVIIQRLKEIQPDAKFFLMTLPRHSEEYRAEVQYQDAHAALLYALAEKFSNTYVLDIRKYGPVYDREFHDRFFMSGHMNAMGYIFTAEMVMSYIDYIIRHNMEDFKLVPFMGTPFTNCSVHIK